MKVNAPTPGEKQRLESMIGWRRFEEAEAYSHRLIKKYAGNYTGWHALGLIYLNAGRQAEALGPLEKAAALSPSNPNVLYTLACAYITLGQTANPTTGFRRIVERGLKAPETLIKLGKFAGDSGRLEEAELCFRRTLQIDPEHVEAWRYLGRSVRKQMRLREGEQSARRALELCPGYADAMQDLGSNLLLQGRLREAEEAFRSALRLHPGWHPTAHSDLLCCMTYGDKSPGEYLQEARLFAQAARAAAGRPFDAWDVPAGRGRLRLGIVSGDFRGAHPVVSFVEPLLRHIDASRIELYAYPTHARDDDTSRYLRRYFAAWKPITALSDADAARAIHVDGVQVLIDLSGHTGNPRVAIFAFRPAPVQVSWLGYFASTGLQEIDWFVADPVSVPPEHAAHFAEGIWRLPDTRFCFTAPGADVEPGPLPALAQGFVTFCCFNNLAKAGDAVLATWSQLLNAVPGSRLFLKTIQLGDESVRSALLARFASFGLDPQRLVLEGWSPRNEYFAAYQRADIGLDTFPFTGGTTTVESLWMGVPVVTFAGDRLVARQGASLLRSAGLGDWVAADREDYVAEAIRRASDVQGLAMLRGQLREQLLASPLFDGARFARHFEAAVLGMWEAHRTRA
jgi:predicted O-linked N-acetylglucosamine transferase (SPINDLY family)